MTTTPLTAIRIDGQMYLKEENRFEEYANLEQRNVLYDDFEREHPPIIALFKCEEGQSFVEGVDVEKITQWQSVYGTWGEIESNWNINDYEINNFKTRQAFQLIEKERGKEAEEWIHPDEAAIGSLNDDLKAVTEQRDELLEALIEAQQQLAVIKSKLTNEKMLWSVNATIDKASVAINKAVNKTS